MIMTGHKSTASAAAASLYEDRAFLTSQSGTALLDKFTHCLLVKCPVDMLDVLLGTLIRQLQLPNLEQRQEAKIVVKRYLKQIQSLVMKILLQCSKHPYTVKQNDWMLLCLSHHLLPTKVLY